MITDKLLKVASAQVVTAAAVSTDTIDLGEASDVGQGEEIVAHFKVDTTATSGGSATMVFQVISSASADLSSPTVLGQSDTIPVASLVAGLERFVKINPSLGSIGQRYLGARFLVATANLTAGAFSAQFVKDVSDGKKFYPSGFTIS